MPESPHETGGNLLAAQRDQQAVEYSLPPQGSLPADSTCIALCSMMRRLPLAAEVKATLQEGQLPQRPMPADSTWFCATQHVSSPHCSHIEGPVQVKLCCFSTVGGAVLMSHLPGGPPGRLHWL